MASFFDDLLKQSQNQLATAGANALTNIGTTMVQNSVNSLFKIGNTNPAVVQVSPQVVQSQSSSNMMYYMIGGGVALLLITYLIVRK